MEFINFEHSWAVVGEYFTRVMAEWKNNWLSPSTLAAKEEFKCGHIRAAVKSRLLTESLTKISKPRRLLMISRIVVGVGSAQGRYLSTVASRRVAIGVGFSSGARSPAGGYPLRTRRCGEAYLCLASRRPGMIFHAEDDSLVFNSPPPVRNIIRSSLG